MSALLANPAAAQLVTRKALREHSNPYHFTIVCALHSWYIRTRNLGYLSKHWSTSPETFSERRRVSVLSVGMEAHRFIADSPVELQRRWAAESEAQELPAMAFDYVYRYPATQTFQVFANLFGLAQRKSLYDSSIRALAAMGNHTAAINLLVHLNVEHDEYLYPVLFPSLFIDSSRRTPFLQYLKEHCHLAEKLHLILMSLRADPKSCHKLMAEHKLVGIPSYRITERYILEQIKWLGKNVLGLKRIPALFHKNISFLCRLRQKSNILPKVFYERLSMMVKNDVDLQHNLICHLLFLRLTQDAQMMVRKLYFDTNRLTEFEQQQLLVKTPVHITSTRPVHTTARPYDVVSVEEQFLDMLKHLESSPEIVMAITARMMDGYLCLLPIICRDRIFVVDPIAGQFSSTLWERLARSLATAHMLLGNTVSENSLSLVEAFRSNEELQKTPVLDLVAFYHFLKGDARFVKVIRNPVQRRASNMEAVTFEMTHRFVVSAAALSCWDVRPLEKESFDYAAEQVAMVWECYMTLCEWFKSRKMVITDAVGAFMETVGSTREKETEVSYFADLTFSELDIEF